MTQKPIILISGIVAALCLISIPVWIMGIPGIQNEYARGWSLGLNAIFLYPISWGVFYFTFKALKKRNKEKNIVVTFVPILGISVLIGYLIEAFKIMSEAQ